MHKSNVRIFRTVKLYIPKLTIKHFSALQFCCSLAIKMNWAGVVKAGHQKCPPSASFGSGRRGDGWLDLFLGLFFIRNSVGMNFSTGLDW